MKQSRHDIAIWYASLLAFAVAALGGALFRLGMLDGFAAGFAPHHIRHAHSHLMLMGWVTPALMVLIAATWPRWGGRALVRASRAVIWASWVLAMACFVPFLLYGYTSVAVGPARLPIAAMLSGVCMLAWFGFAVVYVLATRPIRRAPPHTPAAVNRLALRCWDAAVAFLCLSSLGAWAIAGLMVAGVEDPFWRTLAIHVFVDLFSDGWLVFGVQGLLYHRAFPAGATSDGATSDGATSDGATSDNDTSPVRPRRFRTALALMVAGLLVLYLLAIPSNLVPTPLRLLGHGGALLFGAGLAMHLHTLWPRFRAPLSDSSPSSLPPTEITRWRVVLALLAIKTAAILGLGLLPMTTLADQHGLRILYLHVSLLGFVSLATIAAARHHFGARAFHRPRLFEAAVVAMILTLLPLSGLFDVTALGRSVLVVALVGALLPLVALGASLVPRSL